MKSSKPPVSAKPSMEIISGPILAEVHALSHEGRGIASVPKINGKTVFIDDALPGETVEIQYLSRRGKFDEAKTLNVLIPSEHRVKPECPSFGICGGCALQHLEISQQVLHKQSVLKNHLEHFGKISPEIWLEPLIGPTWGYRKKARLGVKYVFKKGGALVGFRERQGKYLMDMNECAVLHPSVGQKIPELRNLISQLDAKDSIPQIEVSIDDHVTALVFRHLNDLSVGDLEKLINFGQAQNFWIYLQPKGPETVHCIYGNSEEGEEGKEGKKLSYSHPDHGIEIKFSPQDFTQVNSEINLKMVNQALDLLDLKPEDKILDFFCGLGNFTLPMAKKVQSVLGIEGDIPMVKKALENAKLNNLNDLNNINFLATNLFEKDWQEKIKNDLTKYNKVLLDPPRSGAEEVVNFIGQNKIPRIVYVSCNPATLARDAGILVHQYGYRLVKAGIMDMFPHTAHVESMALLVREKK